MLLAHHPDAPVRLGSDIGRQETLTFKQGPVRLENVKVPLLTIVAEQDHIVPKASALAGIDRIGSKQKRTEILPGGHIGVVVGGTARRRLWPTLLTWLDDQKLEVLQ